MALSSGVPVSNLGVNTRAAFISRTYMHLFGAIVAFTLIEVALFSTGVSETIMHALGSLTSVAGGYSWLLVLGAFMVVCWVATHVAEAAESLAAQYAALAAYVLAQSIIFVPLLYIANRFAPGAISSAAVITLIGFALLTAIVFITRKDFSFLKGFLMWGMVLAMLAIVGGVIFNFQLGVFFSVAMIGLAGAAILYDTSNVLHHYPENRYVGASLALFASVALLFWYVLRLAIALGGED